MPRFVIQEHRRRTSRHFDLMLESNGVLKTWSFDKPLKPYRCHLPIQPIKLLPDHRMAYLDYQGKISRGRGSVKIRDKGIYQKIIWKTNFKAVVLKGRKITGLIVILSLRPHPRLHLLPLIHFQ